MNPVLVQGSRHHARVTIKEPSPNAVSDARRKWRFEASPDDAILSGIIVLACRAMASPSLMAQTGCRRRAACAGGASQVRSRSLASFAIFSSSATVIGLPFATGLFLGRQNDPLRILQT